jgi:hypothetical protein
VVALGLFVPHGLVWVDAMRLPVVEFLAVGASVLFWFVILVLLLFLMSSVQLRMLKLLAIATARIAPLLQQIAVCANTVRQFGLCQIDVTIHHHVEV